MEELDSLNAKRLKNREAARRWRQGKKDQIGDLQGEVSYLKNKIDAMQTEMETLRIENQYLKQELTKTIQHHHHHQPPQSPLMSSFSSYPFRSPIYSSQTPPLPPNTPPSSNNLNLLSTPSIFLLCLFLFSLSHSLPLYTNSKPFPGQTTESYYFEKSSLLDSAATAATSTHRFLPRLFHKTTPASDPPKILLSVEKSGGGNNYWSFSMFIINQVYQRLVQAAGVNNGRNLDEVGLLKVPLSGEMNNHISLRLNKFL